MVEIFKPIPEYPDYLISNLSTIKSTKFNKEKILKQSIDGSGYLSLSLSQKGMPINVRVHKLMAITFLNHIPCGYDLVVDHVDGNPLNNKLDNIQVITQRQNITKSKNNKYIGVQKNKNKWVSSIYIEGNSIFLGSFYSKKKAAKAYKEAVKDYNNNKTIKIKKPIFSSEFKNVYWHKLQNSWMAMVYINKKQVFLGYFKDEIKAHQAVLDYQNKTI